MKSQIHVNHHIIRANAKTGANDAPLTVKDYKENRKGHRAQIVVDGVVVAEVVHQPEKPLPCGAKVWIETQHEVRVIR